MLLAQIVKDEHGNPMGVFIPMNNWKYDEDEKRIYIMIGCKFNLIKTSQDGYVLSENMQRSEAHSLE